MKQERFEIVKFAFSAVTDLAKCGVTVNAETLKELALFIKELLVLSESPSLHKNSEIELSVPKESKVVTTQAKLKSILDRYSTEDNIDGTN